MEQSGNPWRKSTYHRQQQNDFWKYMITYTVLWILLIVLDPLTENIFVSNFIIFVITKKCFSVHLLAIAVAKCKFILIDVGDYGRCSDSGVFQSSNTFYIIEYNLFNVPPRPLPGTSENMSFVLLGDQGYPLKKYLMRLYSTSEDADKINFESCSPHSWVCFLYTDLNGGASKLNYKLLHSMLI